MHQNEKRISFFSPQPPDIGPGSLWVKVVQIPAILFGLAAIILDLGFVRPGRGLELPSFPAGIPEDYLHGIKYAAIVGFIVILWLQVILHPMRKAFLKEHFLELVLSIGAAALLIVVLTGIIPTSNAHTSIPALGLTIYLLFQLLPAATKINFRRIGIRAVPLGFALVILAGALLLCLPASSYSERFPDFGNNFVAHLFTATSAVCVTGLNVQNTATDYTPFGQMVIFMLIQAGGLGIIVLGTLFAVSIGRPAPAESEKDHQHPAGPTVKIIIFSCLVIEGIGAIFLYPMWDTPNIPEKIFKSCFHAVSAFCNAGFTLQADNLIPYAGNWQTYGIIAVLIILGGLGFPALNNLYHAVRFRLLKKEKSVENSVYFQTQALALHTKIVLVTTLFLILFGTLAMFLTETPNTRYRWGRSLQYEDIAVKTGPGVMRNHDTFQRLLDAGFLSVSARTGGFNTVDTTMGKLHPGTLLVLIGLMFIGGSPASAAGGIKTVTFMVLLAAVIAALRRQPRVVLFRRTIDGEVIRQALVVLLIYAGVLFGITFALVLTHPQIGFLELLFETTSACGTGGLSAGVTPNLSLVGRLLIILGMFAGRLGPLALLFAMRNPLPKTSIEFPQEELITG